MDKIKTIGDIFKLDSIKNCKNTKVKGEVYRYQVANGLPTNKIQINTRNK